MEIKILNWGICTRGGGGGYLTSNHDLNDDVMEIVTCIQVGNRIE